MEDEIIFYAVSGKTDSGKFKKDNIRPEKQVVNSAGQQAYQPNWK